MSKKVKEVLESLNKTRGRLVTEMDTEADVLAAEYLYIENELPADSPDREARVKSFEEKLTAQETLRTQICTVEEQIKAFTLPGVEFKVGKSAPSGSDFELDSSMGQTLRGLLTNGGSSRPIGKAADDIGQFLISNKFTGKDAIRNLKSVRGAAEAQDDGSTFSPALSFFIGIGDGSIDNDEISTDILKHSRFDDEDFKKFQAKKSMFSQHPLAGGQATTLGVGDQYNPEVVFAGNTGGLFEYEVDRSLNELPYQEQGIMKILQTENVSGNSVHFLRQTIRVNRTKALLDSISTPPVNFVQTKPENDYGWTLFKTYIMTYASTVVLSDEVAEDAKPIVDAVRSQLGIDVMRGFAQSLATGVNTQSVPDITGLLNVAGMNTRIHQGASAYTSPLTGTTSTYLSGDDERITLERAVLDLRRYGFKPNYVYTSWAIEDKMRFTEDGFGRRLYTDEQLANIMGATVVTGVEMPANKAVVGDFNLAARILMRKAIQIDLGFVNAQFITDQFTLRARVRGGLKVMRPYAMEKVTF